MIEPEPVERLPQPLGQRLVAGAAGVEGDEYRLLAARVGKVERRLRAKPIAGTAADMRDLVEAGLGRVVRGVVRPLDRDDGADRGDIGVEAGDEQLIHAREGRGAWLQAR